MKAGGASYFLACSLVAQAASAVNACVDDHLTAAYKLAQSTVEREPSREKLVVPFDEREENASLNS